MRTALSIVSAFALGMVPAAPLGMVPAAAAIIVVRGPVSAPAGGVTPLLWWKMNEGMGNDLTGDGSLSDGGTTDADWSTGPNSNGCLDFIPGNSDDAATTGTIAFGTNIVTVMFWLTADAANTTRIIFESSANFNSNNNSLLIFTDGAGQMQCLMCGTAGNNRGVVLAAFTASTFFHFAVVFDGSANHTIKVYKNAVDQSLTPTGNRSSTANFGTYNVYVGARNSASLFHDGKMDDLRVYSGEVSSSDITAIYNAGAQ